MSDAGGGFEAPRFPSGVINYAQGIRGFGGYLLLPTSFSQKEQSTIFNAYVHMARGVERLGVNDGRAWVQKNMSGFIAKNYTPVLKDNSFVPLPILTLLNRGFSNKPWSVPNGTPTIMFMHEQSHIFAGLNTYVYKHNGPVTGMMELIGAETSSSFLFEPGSLGRLPPSAELKIDDGGYWRTAPAEYFAEVFTALMIDPNHSGIPNTVRQYMIDIITGAQ